MSLTLIISSVKQCSVFIVGDIVIKSEVGPVRLCDGDTLCFSSSVG